tara:strand:+ start:22818 stop:23480 length:663 start_codon:yes stop_codon:yes gene_type:complete
MEAILQIQKRTTEGKKVKTLRNQGITPIHLYGSDFDSASMQVKMTELINILDLAGLSSPITLNDGKNEIIAFAREVQRHPLTEQILHVDFQIVGKDDQVEVEVPINLTGESPAVKNLGGVLIKLMETIRISSKVNSVPQSLDLDISVIESLEQSILVGEIEVAEGVQIVSDETFAVARVIPPRIEVEEEAAEAEIAEGEESEGDESDDSSDTDSDDKSEE